MVAHPVAHPVALLEAIQVVLVAALAGARVQAEVQDLRVVVLVEKEHLHQAVGAAVREVHLPVDQIRITSQRRVR